MNYYAGIEAGGTKFKCLVANDPKNVIAESIFPTIDPEYTLTQVIDYLRQIEHSQRITIQGIGLACFGPLDLDQSSPKYGWITTTPKKNWQNFPILQFFKEHLDTPVKIETDVNAAALGEGKWGASVGISDYAYITVGTGIGGGVIHNYQPLYGMAHPEIGHMKIQPDENDPFSGNCPFHVNCLEGLANAPSIAARWKTDASLLDDDHPAWRFEAYYLGQAIHNLIMICSPKKVILGGGVMKRAGLIEMVRSEVTRILNGYIESSYMEDMNEFIVPPLLGDRAGALGAVALFEP